MRDKNTNEALSVLRQILREINGYPICLVEIPDNSATQTDNAQVDPPKGPI
ncbi:hypothetical protein V1387_00750 [Allomuricauda taeanensis]|uniref:hypothetical protein n=1 Tax=Flagellimonas taeanensis TaxID=1005926 RepID=UPI002E7B6FBC|nr:hypothetical protein [Allomuricauda taeanensis]MEE1961191.1 hypothetical protein [Allomuricauda taeanensis]